MSSKKSSKKAPDPQHRRLLALAKQGIERCREQDWDTGLKLLGRVAEEREPKAEMPSLFFSYLGRAIAHCDKRYREALSLCSHAVSLNPDHPENWANLARIYIYTNKRRLALKALHRGFQLDPQNGFLLRVKNKFVARQPPVIPFLPRSFPLNRWLGKRRHIKQKRAFQDG
jgi:tetratricopeptide (TPR) repeat protein